MKNLTVIAAYLFATTLIAQGGILKESLTCPSKLLGRSVSYSIYLPADYNSSERSYPVLYLLHGYSDDETGWTQFGEVKMIADAQATNPKVTPMIIAMPDAGVDWYMNSHDGKTRYEDFFIEEFIPFIESTYRSRAQKQYRAVAGLSMGGHGTLLYSLKHPDLFAAAAPLSAAVWTRPSVTEIDQPGWDEYFGFIYGEGLTGDDRFTAHLRANNALFLLEDMEEAGLLEDMEEAGLEAVRGVKFYIDCGDDDFLIEGNMELHATLRKMQIEHEFRVRDGAHNWTYWRAALPSVLAFISESFHR